MWALPSSRENLAEWEKLFWWLRMLNFYCSQRNLCCSIVLFLAVINPGGRSELGCYEKILVMVNILRIHPQKFIYVLCFCFWIHPKDLLLFWVFFLQISNNSCLDKQLWKQSTTVSETDWNCFFGTGHVIFSEPHLRWPF